MTRTARGLVTALGVVAVLGLLAIIFSPRQRSQPELWWSPATTFSPGPLGAKALFLLLEREGFQTRRLLRSEYERLSDESVLWILPNVPLASSERRRLLSFIERGGSVVGGPVVVAGLLEDAKLGKPEVENTEGAVETAWDVALASTDEPVTLAGLRDPDEVYAQGPDEEPVIASWIIGQGRAVVLGLPGIVLNREIGRAQNGPFLVRLARELGEEHVFDEFKTGFGEASLWTLLTHAPYRWALLQAALVGLVALSAAGFRRLPAEPLPPIRRRSTQSHVEAVAAFWSKAHDPGLPLEALLRGADERARLRLRGGGDQPFVEWVAKVRPALAERAREAWSTAYRLCLAGTRPLVGEARRAAAELRQVQEDLLRW